MWYEPVAPDAIYERDYERILLDRRLDLFPEFYLVPFKAPVWSPEGCAHPDLALIERRYRHWWVVEVELASHPLEGHVMRQVSIFSSGQYGVEHVNALHAAEPELNRSLLHQMVRGEQPSAYVLVNSGVPAWEPWLRKYNTLLGVVELFQAQNNQYILRMNGDYPRLMPEEIVTYCEVDPVLPRSLRLASPAALKLGDGDEVRLLMNGCPTRWKALASKDRVWLFPTGRCPLNVRQPYYVIKSLASGELLLEQAKRVRTS
ncbi:MAG: hypothetical protein IPK87_10645 [Planctomycetes bacterium]|nr:hypothetical protein [Planctomycetota bacterium]